MKTFSVCVAALLATALLTSASLSQETKKFALKGTTELGGNIAFEVVTPVSNGNSGESTTIFSFEPYLGYFVDDGFELGVNPFGVTVINSGNNSTVQFLILVAPAYNFRTEGTAYPFIEGLVGFATQTDGTSRSGFSWGARGGAKFAVTDKGLLNAGIQYLQITLNPSGAVNRYGVNQLTVSVGFTIWY